MKEEKKRASYKILQFNFITKKSKKKNKINLNKYIYFYTAKSNQKLIN